MFFQGLHPKVTRARRTSDMMFSAAAIAVVSEVNPDQPGASLFLASSKPAKNFSVLTYGLILAFSLLSSAMTPSFAAPPNKTPLTSASYNNTLITVSPMLFHRLELGMTYETVVRQVGKSALYCDSGESYCNAENGLISKKCLEAEFIQPNKTWLCHWDGSRSQYNRSSGLDVWFVGARVSQVVATMPNGSVYRRDSSNTIQLERREAY